MFFVKNLRERGKRGSSAKQLQGETVAISRNKGLKNERKESSKKGKRTCKRTKINKKRNETIKERYDKGKK